MLELQILSPSEDGFVKTIEWNHEEILKEVEAKMMDYEAIVYTEDQIKIAKADRAVLNKFKGALEGKRKEVKKLCMSPYEDFERKMKEITMKVDNAIGSIDRQVKEYEDQAREEKKAAIIEYFNSLPKIDGFESLELARIWDDKWLNASVSLKKVQGEIDGKIEQIKKDMELIISMNEYTFEALSVYRTTLDVNGSLAEAKRMVELQRAKEAELERQREAAEKRKAEAEVKAVEVVAEEVEMPQMEEEKKVLRQWISFKAYLSVEEAKKLKAFFAENGIQFMAI